MRARADGEDFPGVGSSRGEGRTDARLVGEKDQRRRVVHRNHRKRDETKRVKEAVRECRRERTDTGRAGGRETEKDEGHEGRAIFLKNIPQTVAREGEEARR